MNAKSIRELGGDRFHVQSVTDPLHSYHVDLGNDSCECLDWLRIRFANMLPLLSISSGTVISALGHWKSQCPQLHHPLGKIHQTRTAIPARPRFWET